MKKITALDLQKNTYCAIEFAIVEEFTDLNTYELVSLDKCAVVEVAAVKVANGKIKGHFHSFVAIDGYSPRNIKIETSSFISYSINELHLIGAPRLDEVIRRLREYVGDSVVLVNNNLHSDLFNPLYVVRKQAQVLCCPFGDEFIRIKDLLDEGDKEKRIQDIFLENEVPFNPNNDSFSRSRNDALSWALAYAQLLINVVTQQ